jgi:hypothetical protein
VDSASVATSKSDRVAGLYENKSGGAGARVPRRTLRHTHDPLPAQDNPFKTARAFIEAEVHPSYDKLFAYVEIMLGIEWAKRIADNVDDGPGAPQGNQNAAQNNRYAKNNPYAHKDCFSHNGCFDAKQYGTSKTYLLEHLPVDVVDQIGKGKKFKTVHEAARKTGLINVPLRYYIPSDPEAAAHYLVQRVDAAWLDAFMAELKRRS